MNARVVTPVLPGRKPRQDDPGPVPAAAVLAAALPRGFMTPLGWRASSLESLLRSVTEDTITKLEGAGKMLGVLAVYADAERGPSLRFIASGLLEQAHLLRAAVQAKRDLDDEEERERTAALEKRRTGKGERARKGARA